ncbi:MAG: hypothetical protein OXF02_06265 [Simkaniaceae bacterium]|nr:hypothetical protein [Simkaniaceae bacterium]
MCHEGLGIRGLRVTSGEFRNVGAGSRKTNEVPSTTEEGSRETEKRIRRMEEWVERRSFEASKEEVVVGRIGDLGQQASGGWISGNGRVHHSLFLMCRKTTVEPVCFVDREGYRTAEVPDYAGQPVKEGDSLRSEGGGDGSFLKGSM